MFAVDQKSDESQPLGDISQSRVLKTSASWGTKHCLVVS